MITRWYNDDNIEAVIASAFAGGKGPLFEMFFGWRANRNGKSKFVFSNKDWKRIDIEIAYYKKYVLKKTLDN